MFPGVNGNFMLVEQSYKENSNYLHGQKRSANQRLDRLTIYTCPLLFDCTGTHGSLVVIVVLSQSFMSETGLIDFDSKRSRYGYVLDQ